MVHTDLTMTVLYELAENVNINRFTDKPNCAYIAEELVDLYSKDYRRLDSKEWNTVFNKLCDYLMTNFL